MMMMMMMMNDDSERREHMYTAVSCDVLHEAEKFAKAACSRSRINLRKKFLKVYGRKMSFSQRKNRFILHSFIILSHLKLRP